MKPVLKADRKIKVPRMTQVHPFYKQQQRQLELENPTFESEGCLLNTLKLH